MKNRLMLWLSLVCCILIATPVYARGGGGRGGTGAARSGGAGRSQRGGSWERKTDRKIDRRVDREMDRKAQRRDEIRDPKLPGRERKTDRRIERRTEREGERKEERRDERRGSDRREVSAQEGAVERKQQGSVTEEGAPTESSQKRGAARDLYKENRQQRKDLYQENKAQRHELYNENSVQRKELKTSLDTSGDGKLSKEEVVQGKDAIKSLYDENSAERQGLYQENKGERHNLYDENSQQRRDLLKSFDFDGDGKISQEEMKDADAVLDSMEE